MSGRPDCAQSHNSAARMSVADDHAGEEPRGMHRRPHRAPSCDQYHCAPARHALPSGTSARKAARVGVVARYIALVKGKSMRFRKTFTVYATTAALVALAACSADDPLGVNSGDPLSPQEIQSVFDAMSTAFASGGVNPSSPSALPGISRAPIPIDQEFIFAAACPLEGSIGINGSADGQIDDETLAGNLSIQFTHTFNGCMVSANGITITVSHNPPIVFQGDFTFSQDELSVDGSERGGFEYVTSDDREGSCAIDMSFSISHNSATQTSSASVTGRVCGVSADQFTPLNISGTS